MGRTVRGKKRLRYACQVDGCEETFVTAVGFSQHADRDHGDEDDADVYSLRRWVEVGDDER